MQRIRKHVSRTGNPNMLGYCSRRELLATISAPDDRRWEAAE
jgi:hypothetical protein